MIKARAVSVASALAIVSASITACEGLSGYRASSDRGSPSAVSISCRTGYVSQSRTGVGTFTPGEHTEANAYEITFTNTEPGRTDTVGEVGIGFYDAAGTQIGSDIPIGSKTNASGNMHIAAGHSRSVIFFGPNSGFGATGNSAPGSWVPDVHMPSRASRCEVLSWTVGY